MMKSGEYYVGDLCYVFGNDNWSLVCDTIFKDNLIDGEFNVDFPRKDGQGTENIRFAIYSTAYGDGLYNGTYGNYCVDAGSIGCIAIEDLEKIEDIDRDEMTRLGAIVAFTKNFSTGLSGEKSGFGNNRLDTINIGDESIYTGWEEEEEDEYDPWEDEEDENLIDEY